MIKRFESSTAILVLIVMASTSLPVVADCGDGMSFEIEAHRRYATVLGHQMSYVEIGEGDPIVIMSGNMESSYSWRKVIPYLSGLGHIVAIDNMGQGRSDKLDPTLGLERYRFAEQTKYVSALIEALGVSDNVILIGTDWGASLAFDWAAKHPDRVQALVFMEAMVEPYTSDATDENWRVMLDFFHNTEALERYYQAVEFIPDMHRSLVETGIAPCEVDELLFPYLRSGEDRRTLITWPMEIPVDGEPSGNHALFLKYLAWLKHSDTPKLFVRAEPGFVIQPGDLATIHTFRNTSEVSVAGEHWPFESSPQELGQVLASWIASLRN